MQNANFKLLPTKFEIILYFVIAILTVFVSNMVFFVQKYGTELEQAYLQDYLPDSASSIFDQYINKLVKPDTADFVFWLLISVLVVFFIKLLQNVYRHFHEEVDFTRDYAHPGWFNKKVFWESTILNTGLQVVKLLLAVFLWFSLFVLVIPLSITLTQAYIQDPLQLTKLPLLLLGVILAAFGIGVCVQSVKLVFLHLQVNLAMNKK